VVVGKTEAPAQVPPLLLDPVPLDGLGLGRAISLPVSGVIGTPFPRAVAADLTILGIDDQFLFTVLTTTLLLTRLGRADRLLRVKSGWDEVPLAETATPLIHPFKVPVLSMGPRESASADRSAHGTCTVGSGSKRIPVSIEKHDWERNSACKLQLWGVQLSRLAG
jgi:hypothetical protein